MYSFTKTIFQILLISLFFWTFQAKAASFHFSPLSGEYFVGEQFSVEVQISTKDVPINSGEATISFEPEKLEVLAIKTENSIFNLWIKSPSFSNKEGKIEFIGGRPSPGFLGEKGKVLEIIFRGKSAGETYLNFLSASILANDEKGTNVISEVERAKFTLLPQQKLPALIFNQVPQAPKVFCKECENENEWCSKNLVTFFWELPKDVISVSFSLDKNPETNPKEIFEPKSSAIFSDLEDGIWYFHINFKNNAGWGKLTHRKLMIDTSPPEISKFEIVKKDSTDPRPILFLQAKDQLSGFDYFEVLVGKEKIKSTENFIALPLLSPGKHLITIKACDKAGNCNQKEKLIEILPIASPKISECPSILYPGSKLVLKGESPEGSLVKVFLQKNDEKDIMTTKVKVNDKGEWMYESEPLKEGKYKVWVQGEDERGALSLPSAPCEFSVALPGFVQFGKMVIDYLTVIVTLLLLLVGTIFIIAYVWYRISIWRKRLKRETKELAQAIFGALRALREEVEEQIEYLDGKPGLTESERRVREKLKEALAISEKFIGKELQDLEKELGD
ncbi:hypothetical protein H5T58_01880 [Candidatus Parcubacteria bacterium]|nr:hypothetical protein [Candidatus Parcubacteria bacterium]